MTITPQIAGTFQSQMMGQVKGVVVEKTTISALSKSLLFGIDLPALIPGTSVTLGPIIFLEYLPDPTEHVLVVTHEAAHVLSFWEHPFEMQWLYVTEPEARVAYECDAKRSELEVMHALALTMPTEAELDAFFRSRYNLREQDVLLGMQLIERAMTSAQAGVVSTVAGNYAISTLQSLGAL